MISNNRMINKNAFVVLLSLVVKCKSFTGHTTHLTNQKFSNELNIASFEKQFVRSSSSILKAHQKDDNSKNNNKNDDDEEEKEDNNPNLLTYEELQQNPELWREQQNQSKRFYNNIMIPYNLSKAISSLFWCFVALGFLLNSFGYGYVRGNDGFIKIDTLENRDFLKMERKYNNKYNINGNSNEEISR